MVRQFLGGRSDWGLVRRVIVGAAAVGTYVVSTCRIIYKSS